MPPGRPPKGSRLVDKMEGSDQAKERLRVILQTIQGTLPIADACEQLKISESRFHQIRNKALEGSLEVLESGKRGRPPAIPEETREELARMKEEIRDLRHELKRATAVAEVTKGLANVQEGMRMDEKKKRSAETATEEAEETEEEPVAVSSVTKAAAVIDADRQDRATKRPRAQAGLPGQIERRRAERKHQRWVCQIVQKLLDLKATWSAIEVALGLCERVLRRWMKTVNEPIVARGRRPKNVDIELWLDLYFFMKAEGHNTGEPTLRKAFPGYPPGALRRDMRFFRNKLKQERKRRFRRLRWMRPGTVWAMDHGVAPGEGPTAVKDFLVIRDLASRETLSAKSVPGQDAASTIEELSLLFSFYGRPLVIKADNGSAFISKDTRRFLSDAGVVLMLSPVYMPSYNGGVERAVYDVKTFADHRAALDGRTYWTQEDLSWARERANRVVGKDMRDRTQRFESGEEITAEERAAFLAMFEAEKLKSRRTMEQRNKSELNQRQMDTADRRACRNALVGSDFLRIEGGNSSSV